MAEGIPDRPIRTSLSVALKWLNAAVNGAVKSTAAMAWPSGDHRGKFSVWFGTTAISCAPSPLARMVPMAVLVRPLLNFQRMNTISRPSGDQSPAIASSSSFLASPPTIDIL